MSEEFKIPKSIHHSRQFQQMDLGETIYLWTGDHDAQWSNRANQIVGEIYNFDDLPGLAEKDCEDVEMTAIAIADKVVRAYDGLLAACNAALEYDAAIQRHAAKGTQWVQGDDLDALYKKWLNACRAAKDKAEEKTQ